MKKILLTISTAVLILVFIIISNNVTRTSETNKSLSIGGMAGTNTRNCMMPLQAEDSMKFISSQITVNGDVDNPLILNVDSLRKMKVVTIENFKVICQSGAETKENKTCKGVLLRDILDKAKISQSDHKDRNFYIVARATDNYKATFSWAEIYNNPTGDNVYVLFEENEQPIKEQGDMILICKNDIKTGPRHVYWLKNIEVKRVD